MLQAALSDCLFLDLLSHFQDLCSSSVIDVGGCQVVQALVVAIVVVGLCQNKPVGVAGPTWDETEENVH